MFAFKRLRAMVWSVALAAPVILHAQTAAPAPSAAASVPATDPLMPVVRATAVPETETATSPVPGYRATRSGTATKTDTPLNEVPQSISVITADQVKDQSSLTMQDVLRYTAGVRNEMYGLDNRGDWFSMRGGSEGSVLLDGLRLPLTGWYGVVRNEPYAFERIEVLRGPASVIAGQNGPGGVVNMVSKRPLPEPQREVMVQLGNYDHKLLGADLGGPIDGEGKVLYRLVALGKDSGTQVQFADEERTFVAPSLTWRPTRDTSLTLFAEYQKDDSKNVNGFFPIEGTLRPAPNGLIPVDRYIAEADWDRYGGERTRWGYHFEQRLTESWMLRQNLRVDRVRGGQRSMYAAWFLGYADATGTADPNGTYLNRLWYATDDQADIVNADLLFEGHLRWGNTRHTVLFGVDGMRNANDQRAWDGGFATPLDVFHNPVYGTFPEPDVANLPSSLTKTRIKNIGVLLQDQMKVDERWVLVAGLRYDKASNDTDTTFGDGSTAFTEQRDSATSKNLGVVYLAEGGWSPYLGYSESFEPVAGTTFDGAPFKPKRGKQIEAGVKWLPADKRVSAAAAIYELKETNRLSPDPDPLHANYSVQLGEVTAKGLELELAADLASWDLLASYTYIDARQTGAEDPIYRDKQLSGIPKHAGAVWALYKFGALGLPGLRAGGGLRYIGKSSDGVDVTFVPAVTLLDLILSYDSGPWRVALNINNATDKTYIATCLERGDCWFGTKRKAIASLAYRW